MGFCAKIIAFSATLLITDVAGLGYCNESLPVNKRLEGMTLSIAEEVWPPFAIRDTTKVGNNQWDGYDFEVLLLVVLINQKATFLSLDTYETFEKSWLRVYCHPGGQPRVLTFIPENTLCCQMVKNPSESGSDYLERYANSSDVVLSYYLHSPERRKR